MIRVLLVILLYQGFKDKRAHPRKLICFQQHLENFPGRKLRELSNHTKLLFLLILEY
jgi:hypothetical protein